MHSLFSLGTFVQKIPPSELGFVCKPELPPHINILFRARPPLRFLNFPHKDIHRNYTGIFDLANNENVLCRFEKEIPKQKEIKLPKHVTKIIDIIKKLEKQKEINKERVKSWNPKNNQNVTGNPYKTLFVYRLGKNITDEKLKLEFEEFGQIKDVHVIKNYKGVSKGYGFVEYERIKDFRKALDLGNKKKINGRHVYVEAERGRTDSKFIPMKYEGENGKGRELPLWLKDEIYNIKKKYPEQVKKAIYEELYNNKVKEDNKNTNDKTKKELEIGEIDDDKNIYKKEYEDDDYHLKKKRMRNNNRSPSSYSNEDYSINSYHSHRSRKRYYSRRNKSDSNDHSYKERNYEKKKIKRDRKEGSEEGEID